MTDALMGAAGGVFSGIDQMLAGAEVPGWVTAYSKGVSAFVPSLPGLLELNQGAHAGSA